VRHAWHYIQTYDMRPRSAFERAWAELAYPQMSLLR